MADVIWVKFPKENERRDRWKRLVQLKLKDGLIGRHSRICSRHFLKENIDVEGYASGDPELFIHTPEHGKLPDFFYFDW